MTLIEGVGDEVVQFVTVVLLIVVAVLAWWSTNARPERYRTVLVMRPHGTLHPVTVSIRTRSNLMLTSRQIGSGQSSSNDTTGASTSHTTIVPRETTRVIPLQEMDSIVDADMTILDNNRLHFYRRVDSSLNNTRIAADYANEDNENTDEVEPASNEQMREMDSIVSAMESDGTTGCEYFTRPDESNIAAVAEVKDNESAHASQAADTEEKPGESNSSSEPAEADNTDRREILIKLKYLNDTLREVDGRLDEMLKDFKRRHFSTELSSQSRVLLIFNGRVLEEAATLRACGLHHRAVVHCLVHPRRAPTQAGSAEGSARVVTGGALAAERAQPERTWDLENVLFTFVSIALSVGWFFRCEYSSMFTASASVALFGLTVLYSVEVFGLYISDTLPFGRRNANPVANN